MGPSLRILTFAGLIGGVAIVAAFLNAKPPTRPSSGSTLPASPAAKGNTPPSGDGQAILSRAILALDSHYSVAAKIRHSVDLFGHRSVGSGLYLEQRSEQGLFFRFSLRLQLGNQPSSLLQVCDGDYLWIYRKLGDGESLHRIDVARVQEALEYSGDISRIGDIGYWPGLGGLPKLLRGLHAAFDFRLAGHTRLAGQVPVSVWRLHGEWKPEKLAGLLPGDEPAAQKGKVANLGNIPGHLPDHVHLFLGKEDGFPYRIEYRRRDPNQSGNSDLPQGRPIVTVELIEVDLDATIDPARFVYNPGDLEPADETADFLKRLGLQP